MRIDDLPKALLELNPQLLSASHSEALQRVEGPTQADVQVERDLQRLCELELSRRGIWYLHLSPRAREKAGTPDILACVNGVAFACELKTTTGRLSEEQKHTLEQMADNGWHTVVVRSIKQFVEELDAAEARQRP